MTVQSRSLSEFLDRLRLEGSETPFTWLIGAGMSATCGIPLARGVSRRIILFEYLAAEQRFRPWASERAGGLTYKADLGDFFDWFEGLEGREPEELDDWVTRAVAWLGTKKHFGEITPDNPDCYQMLFKHLLQDTTVHHHFLTSLVGRSRGVNLAHLGLAGLLRDRPEWGHTVFTTNFDDLLLKAMLSLNHTARVFGDLQSKDRPSLRPKYPQIVHLHGRHTGYRLRNTREQIELFDPDLKEGFKKHLADSHLVVLGYSGWDDLVMQTLREWPEQDGLVRGNVYWVPFRSERTMLPKVREFLDTCPPDKVHLIVDEDEGLDADSFILNLSDTLTDESGGFRVYRQGILEHAESQHSFILSQLEHHPAFDPRRAGKLFEKARLALERGQQAEARRLREQGENLIRAEDLPDENRAEALLALGKLQLLSQELKEAEQNLEASILLWDRVKGFHDSARLQKSRALKALGEVLYEKGDWEGAKSAFKKALYRYIKRLGRKDQEVAYTMKSLADILLLESNASQARKNLLEAQKIFQDHEDRYGQAITLCSLAECYVQMGEFEMATQEIARSGELFLELEDVRGTANALLAAGRLMIALKAPGRAHIFLKDAGDLYRHIGSASGGAQVAHALGDAFRAERRIEEAAAHYREAAGGFRPLPGKSLYGLVGALADLLGSLSETATPASELQALTAELEEVSTTAGNPYADRMLKKRQQSSEGSPEEGANPEEAASPKEAATPAGVLAETR